MSDHDTAIDRMAARRQALPMMERRGAVRMMLRDVVGRLNWQADAGEVVREVPVLNISGGGAAFVGDALPPPGIPVYLRLEARAAAGLPIHEVESRLIATSVAPSGMRVAHLQFVDPCPMDLFERAVDGPVG